MMDEGNGSKMSQNYLRQMEEKIFHIKRDCDSTKPTCSNTKHGELESQSTHKFAQHRDLTIDASSRTKFGESSENLKAKASLNKEINCKTKCSSMKISQVEVCRCSRENSSSNVSFPKFSSSGLVKTPSAQINQVSYGVRRENSSTNSPPIKINSFGARPNQRQYPDDLLRQLSQHEKFESQQLKYNLPPTTQQKSSFEEIPLIDLMKISSDKSFQSTSTKRSNSLPRQKVPVYRKNPRTAADLFNPNFNFNKGKELASMGKSLLESIKSRVFGYKNAEKYVNEREDEWNCDSRNHLDDSLRFPKETRHAMSNMCDSRSKMCISCSRRFKNVQTVDAQTSPISSCTQMGGGGRNGLTIPCPLNLLCDKGIHLGRCEDKAIEKLQAPPVCDLNCTCRTSSILFKDATMKYPGKAEPDCASSSSISSSVSRVSVIIGEESANSESEVELAESATKINFAEDERSLSNAESKTSMATILKLLEPQSVASFDPAVPELPKNIVSDRNIVAKTMNGMNGHANGELNGCGDIITQNQQKGCWTIGLINSKFRYLTAETFGFKINANGTSLKKKQIWTLEPENVNGGESMIYLRSHLDKYLAVDSFGNVTCEIDEKEPGCKFQICVSEDGSGRWALKNVVRGYFLGSTSDKLTCTAKVPADAEFWHIHLAARPQVNLRSVGRKRFAHLSENLDEIQVDANIPWGEDTLFTLEFRLEESGKYAIHTCNNKYLSMQGKLVESCNKDCLFSAEYHSGQLALRDRNGTYLSPIGSKAVLKSRSNTVTKDELFSLEDSLPQASFVASLNSRFVSVKQGVDVTANQDEISDHETFQLEFDWSTKRWYIRTMQDKYWTLETGGGIQASGDKRSSNALFELEWQTDGSLAFRANNGRYVITKRSGHLYATAEAIEDNCKYFFYLINRPILVLKCEQGFVGYKAANNPKLECNKATYECIQVERGDKGIVHFKGQNGKYWHVDSEGVTADSDVQEGFYLELREPTRLCIKSTGGNYITASKNGMFRLGDTAIENATQWEY